jgi:protein TonB
MEHTVEDMEEGLSHRLSFGSFTITIAISLVLHIVAAVILLSGGSGTGTGNSVTYLDLKMSSPVQMSAPVMPVEEPSPRTETAPPIEEVQQPVVPPTPTASEKLQSDLKEALTAQDNGNLQETVGRYSLGFGMSKGYFRSLSQGESLRGDIREYYLNLLQDINAKWWVDQSIATKRISAILINVAIARNGEIVAKEIVRSSGDILYDRAVLAALGAAGPLPPLPASYEDNLFVAPLRLMPPLNLMAF